MRFVVIALLLISCTSIGTAINSQDYIKKFWYNGQAERITEHEYYALEYSEAHEQPVYVTYVLTNAMLTGDKYKRVDAFRADPAIPTGSATVADYKGSGYDRGHLCPAGDMTFSEEAMSESFYMSNMSPQAPSFNRGIWKKLEEQVRSWAIEYDSLIIYTGPLLDSIIGYIGADSVAVPAAYYKTLYAPGKKQSAAFIIPNRKCDEDILTFTVTIDSVETRLGRDLYSGYPVEVQEQFEGGSSRLFLR